MFTISSRNISEAKLILDSGFHGVKIDNCGDDRGIGFELLTQHLNASGKPILIENCDQGHNQADSSMLSLSVSYFQFV